MVESNQALDKQFEDTNRTTTGQSYAGSTGTNIDAGVSGTEYASRTTTGQSYADSTSTNIGTEVPRSVNAPTITPQSDARPTNGGSNPALNRALLGGLIGVTLGSLAGALAGKRIGQGFNHTVKGLGDASKTIGNGLGQTAKGLGDAVKTVAEGTIQAVVGGAIDTAEGVADVAKQTTVGTLDAVQNAADGVNQAVQGAADKAKDTQNARPSQYQGNQYQTEMAATNLQIKNDEIGIGNVDPMPTVYISDSDQTEGVFGELPTSIDE